MLHSHLQALYSLRSELEVHGPGKRIWLWEAHTLDGKWVSLIDMLKERFGQGLGFNYSEGKFVNPERNLELDIEQRSDVK